MWTWQSSEEQPSDMQGVLDPEPHPQHHVILPGLEVARAKRKAVEDVWTWTMCFTMCIAVVGKKHPDMVPEMLAYMLHILWAHREYEEPTWHGYNVPFLKATGGHLKKHGLSPAGSTTVQSVLCGRGVMSIEPLADGRSCHEAS